MIIKPYSNANLVPQNIIAILYWMAVFFCKQSKDSINHYNESINFIFCGICLSLDTLLKSILFSHLKYFIDLHMVF